MTTVTIDRIEGDIAVLEVYDLLVDWPLRALPTPVREGQRLVVRFSSPDDSGLAASSADEAPQDATQAPAPTDLHIEL